MVVYPKLLRTGFTIVELLIVIVVIAILAAVTLVAYTGIREQASLASVQSEAQQATKAIELYAAKNGDTYPDSLADAGVTSAGFTYNHITAGGADEYCLGKFDSMGVEYMTTSFHKQPVVGSCTGLEGWWPLNGSAQDVSGYARNGTIAGAVPTAGQDGAANAAYLFTPASQDYIDTGIKINRDTFSFSVWFYALSRGNYQAVMSETRDCCGSGYRGFEAKTSYTNSAMGLSIWSGGSSAAVYVVDPTVVPLNTWVFMAGTYDGATLKMYRDGVVVASANAVVAAGVPLDSLKIGRGGAPTAGYFNGSIDDARTWSRALTQAEITALYEAGAQ